MLVRQEQKARTCRDLGILNRQRKNIPVAVAHFLEAIAIDPQDHVSCINLAEIYDEKKKADYAIEYSMRAVLAAPDNAAYKWKFLALIATWNFNEYNERLQRAFQLCLESPDISCKETCWVWARLLRLSPRFSAIYRLNKKDGALVFDREHFDGAADYGPLLDPFFLAGLRAVVMVGFPAFEDFLVHLRRWLLLQRVAEKEFFSGGDYVRLAASLSHYCLFTDYIFYTEADEEKEVAALRGRLQSAATPDEKDLAIYACYEPLYKLDIPLLRDAGHVPAARKDFSPDVAGVIQAQVTDYFDLRARRTTVIALTEIDDDVSLKVQEQYEEFPYPRWKAIPAPQCRDEGLPRSKALIAGCGTGWDPLMYAMKVPHAEILAVDLSRSSLAYAMRKAEEFGVKNITYRQADILKLGGVLDGRQFDYVSAIGVLHHMKDPMAGWRVLCDLLKPGGKLEVGLYSKTARRAVVKAREAIARGHYGSDAGSMREFRRRSPQLLEPETLRYLQGSGDYYYLPTYRDLLFHVQEHSFDIADIRRALQALGLRLDTFNVPRDIVVQYRKMFPYDAGGKDLDNWEIFEKKYPGITKCIYVFSCEKIRNE